MDYTTGYEYKEELNRRVNSFVEDHEDKVNKVINPTPHRVLVFVLPKEHRYKQHIILPDQKQNKPVYEGIVIRTFKPYWRQLKKSYVDRSNPVDHKEWDESVLVEAKVSVGDHIVFPHYVGIPVPFMDYDTHKFRLIVDDEVAGVVEYPRQIKEEIVEALTISYENLDLTDTKAVVEDMTRKLMDKFVISLRDEWSRTTSGVGEYSGQ